MSFFGKHKCSKCGREWVGSLGWDFGLANQDTVDKICGCSGERLTEDEIHRMKSCSYPSNLREDPVMGENGIVVEVGKKNDE